MALSKLNMKLHYIYRITNLINDKFYIGKHSTDDIDDNYFGSGQLLLKAFKKYGKEAFRKEILEFFDSEEDAYAKEAELVTPELVIDPMCYNIRVGGLGSKKGINCIWFGRKHTEETKKKMSAWQIGKIVSDDTKMKISDAVKKRLQQYPSSSNKEIQMIDAEDGSIIKIFESVILANAFFGKGAKNANIKGCAQGRQKTAYGYKWTYID